ncbi:MAG: bifunctional adenosylcobinamide kinase/adenosylcobinamide-phosphate guanylyltransferase [Thiotrichales bacterium]|nr:bifunctional adenosylcobinamide kinase/adenosylcobinamide-phosphate guanylyltransferase [Thiotrichales bacterium]
MSARKADNAVVLVLGGVRSGKSAFAEALAERRAKPIYVATAESGDEHMVERIAKHRARRGSIWSTVEAPLHLSEVIRAKAAAGVVLLVDSLGMWVSNLMHGEFDLDAQFSDLLESLAACEGTVVIVSDEVGLGGVADNALAREFADRLGELNQQVAAIAPDVYLVVAGIPVTVKTSAS